MASLLVCDDRRDTCSMLEIAFRKDGHRVETVAAAEAAIKKIDGALYDVIITDINMPGINGIEVLKHARRVSPDSAVILITGFEDYEAAVSAVNAGAFGYIHKGPSLLEELRVFLGRALMLSDLKRQNLAYKRDASARNSLDNIIGTSAVMEDLKVTIRTVAPTGSTVVIFGESGTGKELVARAVHDCSPRADEPFISINCGAFPETLLESELFGYVKGAFTGANQNKRGLFEVASGGTVFLDEISEMSLAMQVKLLRVLQERVIRPVGGTQEIAIDVRMIAATNKDLESMVTEKTFREDLYYRISVIPILVPPLRLRREDVAPLAHHFLKKYAPAAGKGIHRIAKKAIDALSGFDWPGNVRQLENTVERAVAMEATDELHIELPAERTRPAAAGVGGNGAANVPSNGMDMERYVADVERALLQSALRQSGGVQTKAAEMLKLSYRSFRHLMKKYEL
ncbi:MAG: sigma-54 dependent transcriptional regulator [Acidobacteriota bacterium]|nr:sigma-54 dependent transcriptional regulator [Acidobacteriota bacterium]